MRESKGEIIEKGKQERKIHVRTRSNEGRY
jgi:hypothetical protein